MKKPEISKSNSIYYNRACEDWEKFLPSEDEICDLIHKYVSSSYDEVGGINEASEAIAKRLGIK